MTEASQSPPSLLPPAVKVLQPKLTPFSALRRRRMCEISISTAFFHKPFDFFSDFVIRTQTFFHMFSYGVHCFFPCI